MNINLSRFSTDSSLSKALGFSSYDDFVKFTITGLDTCIAAIDENSETEVDFLSMLGEDEVIAIWSYFAQLVDLDEPHVSLMIGSSLSDICKAAAYNNFSGFNVFLNNIPKEIFEKMSQTAKSAL